jgi:hypothetical protein
VSTVDWPGQEAVVGAVRIHDGEALDPPVLGAAFGDIGDAAVEERAFPGQAAVDRVGAFVGGAAPVAGCDDETVADKLALQRNVVEVAADGEVAVGIGAHEALDQRRGAGAGPMVESRCGDFREADRADAAGADRAEQAAARQVSGDDLRHLPAERGGGAGFGVHRLRGRHERHRDGEVLRRLVGNIYAKLRRGGVKGEQASKACGKKLSFHWDSLLSKPMGLRCFHSS